MLLYINKYGGYNMYKEIDPKWLNKLGTVSSRAPLDVRKQYFINKSIDIHGEGAFDYSKCDFISSSIKVILICTTCGTECLINPSKHVHTTKPTGCTVCSNKFRHNTDTFIKAAQKVHGTTSFDYSKVKYVNNKDKIILGCNTCGTEWLTQPNHHLNDKTGCPTCANNQKYSLDEFIAKSMLIHGDRYDYSSVIYSNANSKVRIICKEHGEFEQVASAHYGKGQGCPHCHYSDLESRGVYVLASKSNQIYKIGISNNVRRRIRDLNSEYVDFILINFYDLNSNEHSMKLEKALHQHFKDKQCKDFIETDLDGKTELFNLNEEDVQYIDTYIKDYCKEYNLTLGS